MANTSLLNKRSIPSLALGALLWGLSLGRAAAAPVGVTEVRVEGDRAVVVLNEVLEIRDIEVIRSRQGLSLVYPAYVSERGRRYPQVSVVAQGLAREIERAVAAGTPAQAPGRGLDFEVGDPYFVGGKTRLANVDVVFEDSLRVTLGVLKSKRKGKKPYWVAFPAAPSPETGKFVRQVHPRDWRLKRALERAVLEKFERQLSEQ